MRGLLHYDSADVTRNRRFIEKLTDAANARGMALRFSDAPDPGLEWDFAIIRSRSFSLAERLCARGVKTYNSPEFIRIANDKRLTFTRFTGVLPLPDTVIDPETPPFEYPFVLKPAHGHGGAGVSLIKDEAAFFAARAGLSPDGTVAQRLLTPGRDLRVYILGGEPLAGMLRCSDVDFRSNYSLGGSVKAHTPNAAELALVRAVCAQMRIDYGAADLIYDGDTPVLNELEDAAGARMLYENTDIDAAERFIEYIAEDLKV